MAITRSPSHRPDGALLKPRMRPLKRLPTFGIEMERPRKLGTSPWPAPEKEESRSARERSPLAEIARRLGGRTQDWQVAKRLLQLTEDYPGATLPELVTLDFLLSQRVPHIFQPSSFARRRGSLVPDFLVTSKGANYAWLIQGEYYHSSDFQRRMHQVGRDWATRMKLQGKVVHGVRIDRVLELWENDIYAKRPQIFFMALGGLEL